MSEEIMKKVMQAIETIKSGLCARVDVNKDVKVYKCKNVIRIDIKVPEEE